MKNVMVGPKYATNSSTMTFFFTGVMVEDKKSNFRLYFVFLTMTFFFQKCHGCAKNVTVDKRLSFPENTLFS